MSQPHDPGEGKQPPTTPSTGPAEDDHADAAPDADEQEAIAELATRLFGMAREGRTEQLDAYVAAGVPVNLSNESGDTLLMLAAYHGHAETVRALLARGADPNQLNDRGQAPLAGAVFKGEHEVARVLFDGGADPDHGHPTARDSARMFGKPELLELFDRAGDV